MLKYNKIYFLYSRNVQDKYITNKKQTKKTNIKKPKSKPTLHHYAELAYEADIEVVWVDMDKINVYEYDFEYDSIIFLSFRLHNLEELKTYLKTKTKKFISQSSRVVKLNNKWTCYNYLRENNFNTPNTIKLDSISEEELQYPFVLKTVLGGLGNGVWLINNEEDLKKIKEKENIEKERDNYIVQEYLEKSKGKSIRAYYIDGVVYLYGHISEDDFRSNSQFTSSTYKIEEEELKEKLTKITLDLVKEIKERN